MNNQLHLDTGARALDALPHGEVDAFDAHLSSCESCTEEFTGFLETAALLAAAAAEQPPARMHGWVMRAITVTAQLPPQGRHSSGQDLEPDTAEIGRSETHTGAVTPIRRWYRRPATLLAAAAAAAILIAGGLVLGTRGDAANPTLAMQQCVQSAPDAQLIRPSVGRGGTVTAAASCAAAIIDVGPLPAVPAGKGYQLWVMAGSNARSLGMVQQGADRLKSTFITPLRHGDTDIGISIEPAAGSPAPTTSPLWVVPLTA